jgi:hypothetical protein
MPDPDDRERHGCRTRGEALETDRALARLAEYQRQVMEILAEARRSESGDYGPPIEALARARWELVRLLREYQLFKHVEIFDPLIRAGEGLRADTARSLKTRCLELAAAYSDHVRRWSFQGPTSDWPAYRRDALAMAELIELRLAIELRDVRILLAGVARTRQG